MYKRHLPRRTEMVQRLQEAQARQRAAAGEVVYAVAVARRAGMRWRDIAEALELSHTWCYNKFKDKVSA